MTAKVSNIVLIVVVDRNVVESSDSSILYSFAVIVMEVVGR